MLVYFLIIRSRTSSVGKVGDSESEGPWFESHNCHWKKISGAVGQGTLPNDCPG